MIMPPMRWALLWILLAVNASAWGAANQDADVPLYGRPFKVAGLSFTIPYKWRSEPVENANRAGQWRVPPPHDEDGEGAEVAVFYFGPGIGGGERKISPRGMDWCSIRKAIPPRPKSR